MSDWTTLPTCPACGLRTCKQKDVPACLACDGDGVIEDYGVEYECAACEGTCHDRTVVAAGMSALDRPRCEFCSKPDRRPVCVRCWTKLRRLAPLHPLVILETAFKRDGLRKWVDKVVRPLVDELTREFIQDEPPEPVN